jgi:predicted RND superfamily exporter protein
MKFSRYWLWLLLLIPIGLGLFRLRFDVEVLNLLPEKSPVVRGLKLYQQSFANGQELLITLKSPDADETENAARVIAQRLRAATNLTSSVTWQAPWLEHPAEGAELIAYLWLNQPPEIFAQLTNRFSGTTLTNTLREARDALTTSFSPGDIALRGYDPLNLMTLPENVTEGVSSMGNGDEFFASSDGTFRIVFVETSADLNNYRRCKEWLDQIKAIISSAQDKGEFSKNVGIQYTGRPAFVSEIAGGMEHDITGSVIGTMFIIAILFWWAHRRFRPLLWLLALLVLILGGTMALGGLIFGTLNVVSLGFAAILLGLSVDYGLVLFQEAQSAPHLSAAEIRRELAPGIFWSALTTAGAFAILNWSGLPGLSQLGSLVAIGIGLAAIVMLSAYLPPLAKIGVPPKKSASKSGTLNWIYSPAFVWIFSAFLLVSAAILLAKERPGFDHSPEALRPKNSPAYAAVEQIKKELGRMQEPMWVIVPGENESEVARRLQEADAALNRAKSNHLVASYTLPTPLWPKPVFQEANKKTAREFLDDLPKIQQAALGEGFTTNSLALTKTIFQTWQRAAANDSVFWPSNQASRWAISKIAARKSDEFFALGLIYPATGENGESEYAISKQLLDSWPENLQKQGIILSGWNVLGASMFDLVKHDLPRVMLPIFALLLISLWLAFRNFREVLLSLATLCFSGLLIYIVMDLANWSWNLMNLMAVPLLLGSGVDYSIHVQMALRRHNGDLPAVRKSIGRAVFLCGCTTIAGFGSLAFSVNAGMASLGQICALGIAGCVVTSLYFLPIWWSAFAGRNRTTPVEK